MNTKMLAGPLFAVLSLSLSAPRSAAAAPFAALPEALRGGVPDLDLRLRYESIEVDPPYTPGLTHDDADALTARLRLGYTTAKWNALDAQAEFSATGAADDHYQSTHNLRAEYPTVPDAEGTDVNQLWLRYTGLPGTALKLGRQRLAYDNQRFVGNVAWRQKEQTFDGVTLTGTWLPHLTVNAAWLSNVSATRYFRTDPANAGASCIANAPCSDNLDLDASLLNASWAPLPQLTLTGYGYWLDFKLDSAARRDSKTFGLRASGRQPVSAVTLSYAAEYADQQRFADAPSSVDAHYWLVEAGAAWQRWKLTAGIETLGGDGTYGFQTPLATLHLFQGWADVFLTTPAPGIVDRYASLGVTVEKIALSAVYHDYDTDQGSTHYGHEWNLLATRPLTAQTSVGLKYADYDGDAEAPDASRRAQTRKLWGWVEYKF